MEQNSYIFVSFFHNAPVDPSPLCLVLRMYTYVYLCIRASVMHKT